MASDHSTAIVPLQSWVYESPALRRDRTPIDVGLLAEALIYYDRVLLIPVTEVPSATVTGPADIAAASGEPFDREWRRSFVRLIEWFVARGAYPDLVKLFSAGVLSVYHYAFYTIPVLKDGMYSCWNMQDEDEERGNETFIRRFLSGREFEAIVPRGRHREKLFRALDGHIVELHANQFATAVDNARTDFSDPLRASLAVQCLLDEFRESLPSGLQHDVSAVAVNLGSKTNLTFNVNFDDISEAVAPLDFNVSTPLCGLAHSNRLLWSAAISNCDLYLPTPISRLVNTKLVESNSRRARAQGLIETLEIEVAFPNVREMVNSGELGIEDVLRIRSHAGKFRAWLQTQTERDTNALFAYHHEVAQASGLSRAARKTLRMFGSIAAGGVGAGVGAVTAGPLGAAAGAVVGGAAGAAAQFVFDLAGRLDDEWKPVVFGDWMKKAVRSGSQ